MPSKGSSKSRKNEKDPRVARAAEDKRRYYDIRVLLSHCYVGTGLFVGYRVS